MAQKNMAIAIIISFLLTGLGIAYAGDVKKGLIFFAIAIVLNILGMWVSFIFSIISLIFWVYALYQTYLEVKAVNGY
ncbi:MAG: hypothetical protein E7Z81_01565 [Methanobrevibacter sp.]|uniref:hypothetical protein n=1 Tax=Methanobrevibacter sp. TaxID=66852 RepID=UPI0025F62CE7|nr:hypothetical protein [Methanobrevibacter sp.]MBE6496963.1 hypothetical protein [Methanobrevibacter sp.]